MKNGRDSIPPERSEPIARNRREGPIVAPDGALGMTPRPSEMLNQVQHDIDLLLMLLTANCKLPAASDGSNMA